MGGGEVNGPRFGKATLIVGCVLSLCCVAAFGAADAGAVTPELLTRVPEGGVTGSAAGSIDRPFGIGVDPNLPGDIYVADKNNDRLDVFSPFGAFIEAWGWGVESGSSAFQTCTSLSGCREGLQGAGKGQFTLPEAVAIDSTGDVYIAEAENHRVQKFAPDGDFILTFGAGVNATKVGEAGATQAERNVCTAESGDICQAGTQGSGPGELGQSGYLNDMTVLQTDGSILIGEGERIQKFTPAGAFVEEIALPAGRNVESLTSDTSGNLYASFDRETTVSKLKANGPSAELLSPRFEVGRSGGFALAATPSGRLLVAVGGENSGGNVEVPAGVLEFDPSGTCLNCGAEGEGGQPGFDHDPVAPMITNVASGSACGPVDVYSTHFDGNASHQRSYISIYGEAPNSTVCPPPDLPPEIRAQFGSSVLSREATLAAQINPHFWEDTTYSVEYGVKPCSSGGCGTAPASPLSLDSHAGNAPVTASVTLLGLQPNTTYHFRFVAQSGGGGPVRGVGGEIGSDGSESTFSTFPDVSAPPPCPNDSVRSGLSALLPDCRAYEMVSPVDKGGGDVAPGAEATNNYVSTDASLAEASLDGDRATFSSLTAFAEPLAAPRWSQYLAVRGEDGWTTRSISPPRAADPIIPPTFTVQFKAFSEDLCKSWFLQDSDVQLAAGAPSGYPDAYRRDNCSEPPTYESLADVSPPGFGLEGEEIEPSLYFPIPEGQSTDGSKAVFRAPAQLTSNACSTPGFRQVYLSSEGPLRLVSVLPDGAPACTDSYVGTHQGFDDGFREASVYRAVSTDGERIYWTKSRATEVDVHGNGGEGPGTLYVRVNAAKNQSTLGLSGECTQASRACTYAVSRGNDARFVQGTPDGTKALYTEGEELLEYELAGSHSTRLAGGVVGVIGASEDLSRVYLVSTEALTGTESNSVGNEAVQGQPNIYVEQGGSFAYIATIDHEEAAFSNILQPSAPASTEPFWRSSRITPNGAYLSFTSSEELTGYDNADLASGEPDSELYLYGEGELVCVSCNPTNSRPLGKEVLVENGVHSWASAELPGWAEAQRPTRLLTSNGARLYFESFDALVPRDTNGKRDVYEWERSSGQEGCREMGAELYVASSKGCLSLISSGTSAVNSELIDASEGGRDVFFATEQGLLPQDPGNFDIYDAREEGGFPPPGRAEPCTEGHCQQPSQALASPGFASNAKGPGNLPNSVAKTCPKGTRKVTRNGHLICARHPSSKHKGRHKHKIKHPEKRHRAGEKSRQRGGSGR
jgi:hypothetical protein